MGCKEDPAERITYHAYLPTYLPTYLHALWVLFRDTEREKYDYMSASSGERDCRVLEARGSWPEARGLGLGTTISDLYRIRYIAQREPRIKERAREREGNPFLFSFN